ncbi:MAG: MBL fold metallo-hydrolase [Flavobacteriales bacterium]
MEVQLTFLGSGTSQGVPVIACSCAVCQSVDTRDKRLRSSVLIEVDGRTFVIDTGPDFRQQMLREEVQEVDALVYTHEHKDHVAGMDDIRAFNFRQKKDMPVFATRSVQTALQREFHYVFAQNKYPGVPAVVLHEISEDPFEICGVTWWPLPVKHRAMPVLGFRVGDVAYITDANAIEPLTWSRLEGVDILVLNALRRADHVSHFTLDQALAIAQKVGARETYLTHISHQMGLHADVEKELPNGIFLACDGLKVKSETSSTSHIKPV